MKKKKSEGERLRKPKASEETIREAIAEYFLDSNKGVQELADKYGIGRQTLSTKISETRKRFLEGIKTEEDTSLAREANKDSILDLRDLVADTRRNLIHGAQGIEMLKKIDSPIAQEMVEDIMDEVRKIEYRVYKYIAKMGVGLLKDLEKETDTLRASGGMDLKNIRSATEILKITNDYLGMKNKPQVNIAIQNNQNINQGGGGDKKNIELIVVDSSSDVKKVRDAIDGEIVEHGDS